MVALMSENSGHRKNIPQGVYAWELTSPVDVKREVDDMTDARDPISTFVFSTLVLFTTVEIVRDSLHILMEGNSEGIDAEEIEIGLRACSSVVGIHDSHIWSLSGGLSLLSVHIGADDVETALHASQRDLLSKGITHSTIQSERTSSIYPRNCASDLKCGQALVAMHE
ncbi:putative cation efflux protein [Phytophthora infestans]|uniref:Putative cation efflux protein n=1 Tax=Phytophthora infestans TaxID=4787 RepID=A0A833WDE9_PHYIN|nr:putative cation efflux protein [Phytophthora infestans]